MRFVVRILLKTLEASFPFYCDQWIFLDKHLSVIDSTAGLQRTIMSLFPHALFILIVAAVVESAQVIWFCHLLNSVFL